jgi:DNA-binding transcriptional LysR family regulator
VELRQLNCFVSVAEHLHFGRAAAALMTGQPSVSQHVANLERDLGVRLFVRSGRGVQLTDAGRRFLPEARSVLQAAERAKLAAQEPTSGRTLRLGTSTGLGERLEQFLAQLGDLAPDITVELVSVSTKARLERVSAGQLDAAFVRGSLTALGVELIEVWHDRLLIALPASHPLAASERCNLAELADLPLRLVAQAQNPPLVDLVLNACTAAGFAARRNRSHGTLENTLAAIAGAAPNWTVVYETHARQLRQPRIAFLRSEPDLLLPTSLALSAKARSRGTASLLQACAAVASHDR